MKKLILPILMILFIFSINYAAKSDSQRYFNSGLASFNDGAYSIAVNLFEKAVSSDPDGEFADDASFYIGMCYFQDNKFDTAIVSFNKFINNYPDSPFKEKAVYLIGAAYYKLKNYEKSIQNLTGFIKTYPGSKLIPEATYIVAFDYLLSGKYDAASDEFKLLNQKYPASAYSEESLFRLGQAYLYDSDYKNAIDVLKQFSDKYVSSVYRDEAVFDTGKAYYLNNDIDKALPYLLGIVSKTNLNFQYEALYYTSMCYIKQDKFSESLQYLTELSRTLSNGVVINEYRDEALYKIALLYKLKNDIDSAVKYLVQLTNSNNDPEYSKKSIIELASCYVLKEDYSNALAVYEKIALSGGESEVLAYSKIAELEFLEKDYPGALSEYEKINNKFPDMEYGKKALYWMGRCCLELEQYKNAISYFENYSRTDPINGKSDEVFLYKGHAYAGLTNYDWALESFGVIISNTGSSLRDEALSEAAWVYIKKEDYAKALTNYKRLIGGYPSSPLVPEAYYSMGIIGYNDKDYNNAEENFKKVTKDYKTSTYSADASIKIAWIYYKQEKFEELNDYLKNLDKQNLNQEQKSEVYNLLGWANFRLKIYYDAAGYFKNSIALTQDKNKILEGWLYIAKSYYNLEDYTNSIDSYNQFIDRATAFGIKDDIPAALSDMAWCNIKMGEQQKAALIYQNLTDNYPDSGYTAEALFKLAEYYYNLAEYKKAVDYYNKILTLKQAGDFAPASIYWMAWSYNNMNDMINAVNMFERYFLSYPKGDYSDESLWRAALIYYNLSNFDKAGYYLKKLIDLFPGSPDAEKAKIQLSDIELKQKSGGNEEKMYRLLIDQSKTPEAKASAMYKLALVYKREEKIEDALKLFNDVINISTGDEAALSIFELAEYNKNKGNYIDAIKQYGNIFYVYKYTGLYPQSLYGLSYCYYKTDNADTARKYLERIIDKYPGSDWAIKSKELLDKIGK